MDRAPSPQARNRNPGKLTRVVVAAVALGLTGALGLHGAGADELDDRRAQLDKEIAAAAVAVDDASAEVSSAVAAYEKARAELASAEAELDRAEKATDEARKLDEQRADELADAEHKVAQAEADVAAAQAAFDSVDARTNEEITVITQQSGPLVDLALLFTDISMSDLNHRAQLAETLLSSSALELDELTERRFTLDAAESAAEDARSDAQVAREAAAAALADTEAREAAAEAAREDVAAKLMQRDEAKAAAEAELAKEEARQADLAVESADVDRRIAERIAKQEAERKAKEEADRKAREKAEADRLAKEAADRRAREQVAAAPAPAAPAASKPASSASGFIRPVEGRLTSQYGMRLHPILGYRKLHDGTDFGAACGTPIRAAADGVVAERYYNAGYGNRLMIDHGRLGGAYVTTGYNHATRYVVSVNQRVTKGQVVGYVGSTGYSTGCHLHLMVWENGSVVNPMAKWFK